MQHPACKIGLAGFGTVGTGLARLLKNSTQHLQQRTGKNITLSTVAVRNTAHQKDIEAYGAHMVTDWKELVADPGIDIIVELIGGTTDARELLTCALEAGKQVVTANKALLAEHGQELFALAEQQGVHLGFEASVAGGIPVVQTLRGGLAGNKMHRFIGILNGTANFILTQMSTQHLDFATALQMAQDKGYAEADPTLDITGQDAAHKLTLLIQLALGAYYPLSDIPVTGVNMVNPMDIAFAAELGYTVKLIAQARAIEGGIEAGVYPALVPHDNILASVHGSFNAICLEGEGGPVLLHGHGAGALPTGSAVLADIMAIARGDTARTPGIQTGQLPPARQKDLNTAHNLHYTRFIVPDSPGILRDLAAVMAKNNISIAQAIQKEQLPTGGVPLVMLTHTATAHQIHTALQQASTAGLTAQQPIHYRIL